MRKISVLLILILSLTLVGCRKKDDKLNTTEKANISIVQEDLTGNVYTFKLEVNDNYSDEDLFDIFTQSAFSLYLEIADDISINKYFLNIDFKSRDKSYGSLKYVINNSVEQPGLTLLNNSLTIN